MVLLSEDDIGAAAWARVIRSALVTPLTSTTGIAADVVPSPAVRASAIEPWVPARSAVTGLSALWVWGFARGSCPIPFRVSVPRGRHPDPPRGCSPARWQWHTDHAEFSSAVIVNGVPVVSIAHAVASALRTDDLGASLEATARALRGGGCTMTEVDAAVRTGAHHRLGRERQESAWTALRGIIQERAGARP